MPDLYDKLEPEARQMRSIEGVTQISIAVSLKRIADALEHQTPINSYGETLGEAIQGQIVRGLRGIDHG